MVNSPLKRLYTLISKASGSVENEHLRDDE